MKSFVVARGCHYHVTDLEKAFALHLAVPRVARASRLNTLLQGALGGLMKTPLLREILLPLPISRLSAISAAKR